MTITNTIHEPFFHTDVAKIAAEEVKNGIEGLGDRVKVHVEEIIGTSRLPDRIKTWIHQICRFHISQIPTNFYGKTAEPIDLTTIRKEKPEIKK